MTEARRFRELVRNECLGVKFDKGIDHSGNSFQWTTYYMKDGTAILSCNQTVEEFIPLFDPIFEANKVTRL